MEDSSTTLRFHERKNEGDFHQLNYLIEEGDENTESVTNYIDSHNVTHERYKCSTSIDKIATCVYPTITAAEKGHVLILNTLIARGFDPNYKRKDCYITRMPIHYACRNGHIAVVRSLIVHHAVDPNAADSEGETALSMAIYAGSLEIVKFLVESGAVVNSDVCLTCSTPLHLAVQQNQPDIVEFLISAGANVNQTNYYGYPPLSFVPHLSSVQVARMLLEAGAKTEAMSPYETPFSTATKRNMLELVKLLHKYGANPEAVNKDGHTPLQLAMINEHYDIARYLLFEVRVSLDYTSGKDSPIQIALDADSMKMVYLLLEADYEVKMNFFAANETYSDNEGILSYIRHNVLTPRSLRHLCCFSIRKILGKNVSGRADYLPLPERLKAFVKQSYVP